MYLIINNKRTNGEKSADPITKSNANKPSNLRSISSPPEQTNILHPGNNLPILKLKNSTPLGAEKL